MADNNELMGHAGAIIIDCMESLGGPVILVAMELPIARRIKWQPIMNCGIQLAICLKRSTRHNDCLWDRAQSTRIARTSSYLSVIDWSNDPVMTGYMNQVYSRCIARVFSLITNKTMLVDGTARSGIEAVLVSVLQPGDKVFGSGWLAVLVICYVK